ncbi:MAG TPA: glycosyltransferase family 2 protein, partial [Mycobacteriales bacterium]|nr:glycosyltransferase family 2 protein [Mycobacteriales bacterium]
MGLDVSVVIPTYNTGEYLQACIDSLLTQSLPTDRYELIFVDDGSTDETPQRLDRLAAEAPNVRVFHEPASGWPGRPRNVGIDAARGEFVYFCDHDDRLGEEALERLVGYARRCGSDIVIGKMVGHGRGVPGALFRANVERATLWDTPLMTSLTPHKLFRREFLNRHGLRYPEGKRRLEDHVFVIAAYFAADTISVLADYGCYHHARRSDRGNAAAQLFAPADYYRYMRESLDIIEHNLPPGPQRDAVLERPFQHEMVRKLARKRNLTDPRRRDEFVTEIQRVMLERFPPEFSRRFGLLTRHRADALRAGDVDEILRLYDVESQLRAVATTELRWQGEHWTLDFEAELVNGHATRFGFQPDPAVDECSHGVVDVLLVSAKRGEEWPQPVTASAELVPIDGRPELRRLVMRGQATIDVRTAAVGAALTPGRWQVLLRLEALGTTVETKLAPPPAAVRSPVIAGPVPMVAVPVRSKRGGGSLAFDLRRVNPRLVRRLLARPVRRLQLRGQRLTAVLDAAMTADARRLRLQATLQHDGAVVTTVPVTVSGSDGRAQLRGRLPADG